MQRVMVVGDAGQPTGFERVTNGVCTYLHGTGEWDVTVRGLGYSDNQTHRKYPYTVKPTGSSFDDPLGVINFPTWLDEDKPNVVLMIHDIWNQVHWLSKKPAALHSTGYFPVDTPLLKYDYALACGAHSQMAAYTAFGAWETAAGIREAVDLMFHSRGADPEGRANWIQVKGEEGLQLNARIDRLARLQNPDRWHVIPHGSERRFKPMDKAWVRQKMGFPVDAFIVLAVNANQGRKRHDSLIRAFGHLLKVRKDALLVFHCSGGDRNGWDLMQLARYYGVEERTLCVHHHQQALDDEQLEWLYNSADVHANTSGGEGWGLTTMESAECAVPQLVPDWSATRELWKEHALLIPVRDWRHEPKHLNTAHACIDTKAAGELLIQLTDPAEHAKWSALALARSMQQVSWPVVGEAFERIMLMGFTEAAPVPMNYQDVLDEREGEVHSELFQRLEP